MPSLTRKQRWITFCGLGLVLLVGVAVRLHGLTDRTMTHVETYVPGIEFPDEISIPRSRFTLKQILLGMLVYEEPHGPTYYVLMLGWTKLLGSSLLALRLPSVLFGAACILLIWALGVLEGDWVAALVAAGMLALNGLHMYYSQIAKNYIMACLLGLLSTVLLILAFRARSGRLLLRIGYVGVTLTGLLTGIYFWPILATHMLWTLRNQRRHPSLPELFRWQWVTMILGTPMLSYSVYQSKRSSYVSPNPLPGLSHYFQFGFLFLPDSYANPVIRIPILMTGVILTVSVFLLVVGLFSHKDCERADTPGVGPPMAVGALAGACAVLIILGMAWKTYPFDARQTRLVVASSVIPLAFGAAGFVLERTWHRVRDVGGRLGGWKACLRAPIALSGLLAVLPVAMVAVVSLRIPIFTSRSALIYLPYLLLVLSVGLVALARRTRAWVLVAGVLLVIFPLSIVHYNTSHHDDPTDYGGLAERWLPEIEDSDLVFVQPHWATTPIFYYLKTDRYHVVGDDYASAIADNPGARVWVLCLAYMPTISEIEEALDGYYVQDRIEALGIWVELYTRPEPVTPVGSAVSRSR